MCHLHQKKLDVMVASWACEVMEILTQRGSEEASIVRGLEWPHKPN